MHNKNKASNYEETDILRFLHPDHMSHASSYGKSVGEGPSVDISSKQFKIGLLSRLRRSVLTRWRVENPRSQSAVDIGSRGPIVATFAKFGNIACRALLLINSNIISLVVEVHNLSSALTALTNKGYSALRDSGVTTLCGPY